METEAITAIQKHAAVQGYAVAIARSVSRRGRKRQIYLVCDRGLKDRGDLDLARKRNTQSKKIKCPFSAVLRYRAEPIGVWVIDIREEHHNHDALPPSAHPAHRKLSKDDLREVEVLAQAGVTHRAIVTKLRTDHPDQWFKSKDVSNAKRTIRLAALGPRTPTQALMQQLGDSEQFFLTAVVDDATNRLSSLFFAYKKSERILIANSDALVIDATYKTNRYGMPCVDVIGVTALGTNFYIGFAFLAGETTEDYEWLFGVIKGIYTRLNLRFPRVITTDRDLALIAACMRIFPAEYGTKHFLCVWHVDKAVYSYCRKSFDTVEAWNSFNTAWHSVLYAESLDAYRDAWMKFSSDYGEYWKEIDYLKTTWIDPWSMSLLRYWTNRFLHFGLTVTSRSEGGHAILKKYIGVSTGDLKQVNIFLFKVDIRAQGSGLRAQGSELRAQSSGLRA